LTGGKLKLCALAACALALPASQPAQAAYGYCSQPMAPSLYARKPSKPYCAVNRSCNQWEVDSYKSDIDRYFRSLKSYLGEVDSYYEDAYAYAKCMAELD
jgi:hypothetical protein